MTHGLDTGFLVAAEVTEHAEHAYARTTLARLLATGDLIALHRCSQNSSISSRIPAGSRIRWMQALPRSARWRLILADDSKGMWFKTWYPRMSLAKAKAIGRKRRQLGRLWPMPVRETDLGHIYAEVTVRPLRGSAKSWTGRVLVDTGATDTFLPAGVLRRLGIRPSGFLRTCRWHRTGICRSASASLKCKAGPRGALSFSPARTKNHFWGSPCANPRVSGSIPSASASSRVCQSENSADERAGPPGQPC
jgi:hypothetical protein